MYSSPDVFLILRTVIDTDWLKKTLKIFVVTIDITTMVCYSLRVR